ncbi:MAG: tetratricopeptide repeat protein [Pirellulales bacterium]|nr:tetratricopeptide repeat protein [Pirellulales bacterium]
MKALDKDRNRRYETANGLADDIDRYLRDDIVLASPPSWTYQLWKAVKQHRVASLSITAVSMSLLIGLVISLIAIGQVRAAQQVTEDARSVAEQKQREAEAAAREKEVQRQEAVRQRGNAVEAARNASQALNMVLGLLSKATLNPETGRPYTVQEALDDLVLDLENDTQMPPEAAAQLHLAIGKAFYLGPRSEQAKKHFEKVITLEDEASKPDDLAVAQARRYLGALERGPAELLRAAEIERRLRVDQELSKTLTWLGIVMHQLGKLDEAEKYLSEACLLFKPSDPTIPLEEIPFFSMVNLLRDRLQPEKADRYEVRAVSVAKELYGTDASMWMERAGSYRATCRYRAFEYTGLIALDLLGPDATDRELQDISNEFRWLGRFERANRCLMKAIEKNRTANRPDKVGWCLLLRARLRSDLHDYRGAEALLREAFVAYEQSQQHQMATPQMDVQFRSELSEALLALGRSDEAKRAEGRALAKYVAAEYQRLASEGVSVWMSGDDKIPLFASLLRSGQKVDPADILSVFEITNPDPREWDKPTAILMGLAWQQAGEYEQAISARETAAKKRTDIGLGAILCDYLEEMLLELYIQQGELDRAESFFTELIAARDEWLPEDQPNRAFTRILLARVLILRKANLDRAKTLLLEARKILEKHSMTPDEPKQEIAKLLNQIAQAGDDAGQLHQ